MSSSKSKDQQPNINNYEFNEKIGSGSYANVFRATKKDTKEIFAIKVVLKTQILRNSLTVDNLISEIYLLKRLKHRNVVQMFDFCWDEK